MTDYLKINFKSIIIITITLMGIIISVYLVQTKQIFKSKALDPIYNTIEVTQTTESGEVKKVACQENNCTIDSLDIEFRLNVNDLEDQINTQ